MNSLYTHYMIINIYPTALVWVSEYDSKFTSATCEAHFSSTKTTVKPKSFKYDYMRMNFTVNSFD